MDYSEIYYSSIIFCSSISFLIWLLVEQMVTFPMKEMWVESLGVIRVLDQLLLSGEEEANGYLHGNCTRMMVDKRH